MTIKKENLVVDNSKKPYMEVLIQTHGDFLTVWLGKSPMPLWVRCWIVVLLVGVMSPFAFLPHPYAIADAVGMVFILIFNGLELVRVRGVNKNMGWPHLVGCIPVLVVDALSLFTSRIDGEQLTWQNAGVSVYYQARVFFVWYNFVTLIISCLFDTYDTFLYYFIGEKWIDRSDWTIQQLEKGETKQITESIRDRVDEDMGSYQARGQNIAQINS